MADSLGPAWRIPPTPQDANLMTPKHGPDSSPNSSVRDAAKLMVLSWMGSVASLSFGPPMGASTWHALARAYRRSCDMQTLAGMPGQ
jgi:hypothetical protein